MINFFERLIKKPQPAEVEVTADEQEAILESRDVEKITYLYEGRENVAFIKLKDDGAGIFKPEGMESDLRKKAPAGTQFKRERAAYLIDKFLGFGLVPSTVIREINGQKGTVQQFISDYKTYYELRWEEQKRLSLEMIRLWIFDYIIYSLDRHGKNIIVKNGRVYAIDNGLSFGQDRLLTYKDFFDTPVPEDIKNRISVFLTLEDAKRGLKDLLSELLPQDEVEACFKRIERIYGIMNKYGRIPSEAKKELTF